MAVRVLQVKDWIELQYRCRAAFVFVLCDVVDGGNRRGEMEMEMEMKRGKY